jgi:prepilin-type N-terminal cleavage/methylation domain-containing protein/prepilin-type processing-associated H-X9-DG protein
LKVSEKSVAKKGGFTLIELLVVIAIIALLAAILFPVFARARDNARRSTCISNIKQVGLGILQYCQDNDERYPPSVTGWPAGAPGNDGKIYWDGAHFWEQMIFPYVKSHQIFFCPSTANRMDSPQEAGSTDPLSNILNGNYGLSEQYNTAKMSIVTQPANKYMLLEWGIYQVEAYYAANPTGSYYLPGVGRQGVSCSTVMANFKNDCENGRHFEGSTIGYADGHVKWLKTSNILSQARTFLVANKNGSFDPKSES